MPHSELLAAATWPSCTVHHHPCSPSSVSHPEKTFNMSSEQSQLPRSSASDYEFLEKLGRGNSGTVFKVRRRSDKKFYVVKQVRHPQLRRPSSSSPRFTSVVTIARQVDIGCVSAEEQTEALNECSILASMNHPNVIQCAHSRPDFLQPFFGASCRCLQVLGLLRRR